MTILLCLDFAIIPWKNTFRNCLKMDITKSYNDRYVIPFIDTKKKYPELKENIAIRMSNYSIFGNYISEAILLGNLVQKNEDNDKLESVYNNVIFPSFEDFIGIYFGLFENVSLLHNDDIINIKNRHKLFDMKKAFMSMLYDFFYDLTLDDEDDV